MLELQYLIFTVIILALVFDFINGFHDTANAIATSVSTRALQPNHAIMMAAVLNFFGAMVSTGVAKTIGGDIVSAASVVDEKIIIAALFGAIVWNLLTWYFGIPSSSSHALVGGLIGAVLISVGASGLNLGGIGKIVVSLIASPVIAIVTGIIIMNILFRLFGNFSPHTVNDRFRKMQILSAATMAFSHGSNDAQKSMGIITLALFSGGFISEFEVPTYVKILCAAAMALGTATGGWRIIKTIGGKIFKPEPISGFAADLNSSVVVFGATLLHLPVSTTHVVSGSIMGVGTAKRVNAVHWGVAQQMVKAWVMTIPITAAMGAGAFALVDLLFQ
ncbi:MAG: inorganic phosphate transporter [Selenomonadaceae bacterium]|nr:inorganic phosphate transporter [Selenomonadaceae bacterium]MBQ9495971.1 inorganic phosphate transporter [Selenomonadaceae bacterium]